ncbi:MAG: energy transducer TonB [Bacteroidia bacterium]
MDNKNPTDEPHNFSPEELFKLLDAENSGQDGGNLDEFEREALEGLKLVKNREKVFGLNSKIDALLEEEKDRKAIILPKKNNKGLYYMAMAASVALIIGFFFLFQNLHKEAQVAVKKDTAADQASSTINGNTSTETVPLPVNSDGAVIEEKAPQEKEMLKVSGEGNGKGPVSGKGVSDLEQSPKNEKTNEGYFAQEVNKETAAEELSVSYKTAPVLMDEVVTDDSKKADKVSNGDNMNNISTTSSINPANTRFEEKQKKKEAETEKKALAYNADMNRAMNARNDTLNLPDLAKNTSSNADITHYNGTANSPVPAGAYGLTTTSPTYSWSTTSGAAVLAKATKREESKTKGKKRKIQSKSYAPAYSGTKEEDKKAKTDEDLSDKDIALKSDIKQKQQDERALAENGNSVLTSAEIMPEYPGGTAELQKYLAGNLSFEKSATSSGNKLLMSFIVKNDGNLGEISISKGLEDCNACRDKVIKAFNEMPKWKPGMQNGKPVSVRMSLPIIIDLK